MGSSACRLASQERGGIRQWVAHGVWGAVQSGLIWLITKSKVGAAQTQEPGLRRFRSLVPPATAFV